MQNEPMRTMLSGTIEVDECYVGGKPRGTDDQKRRRERWSSKAPVVALIQRDGKMRTKAPARVTASELFDAMRECVKLDESRLMTDQMPAYKNLGKRFKKGHEAVQHNRREYARGDAHVNTCESFFALLKRGIHGTFHNVSKQHLQKYADEFAFRWNHRKTTDGERTEAALRLAPNCRLVLKAG